MDVSVIICTFNRSHNLPDCFNCLEKQIITEPINWHVVLVDNNSTDQTKVVVQELNEKTTLNVSYVFEVEQGLSAARNKGINSADGRYLIFIDDDIRVTQHWLQTIFSTFKKYDCDAVGGRIHIESPAELPPWISADMHGFLGHQDFGSEPHAMDGIKEFPFGGNMAMHKRVIDLIGNFDTSLGRKGTGLVKEELFKGEETDYFHRLAAKGGVFYYHPDALVFHKILPHQLKRRFFLNLHINAGTLKARFDNASYPRNLFGAPLFLFPQLMRAILAYLKIILSKGPDYSIRQFMNVVYFWGMIRGYQLKYKAK